MTTDTLAKLAEFDLYFKGNTNARVSVSVAEWRELHAALTAQALPAAEPFGYFKAEPFGWADCAETDDGAVALYEGPQQAAQALTEALALSDDALSHAINQAACDIATDRAPDDRIRAIGRALWRQWQAQQATQALAGWREQHDRDSAEPRSLCRARDVARQQRDHARACYDSAVKLLTGIHALLYPAPITVPDGRTMVFRPKDPDPHAVLQELSDRIRALPDALAALPQPPQPQSAQSKGDAA